MPILHRLAAFRDDVVFVVLLYQMYIYRVDLTRANEYGQQLSPEAAAELEKCKKETKLTTTVKGVRGTFLEGEDKVESKKDI